MTLSIDTARTAIPRELDAFADRVSGLTPEDLARQTPCPEFDVRGLTGHLAASAQMIATGFERWVEGITDVSPEPPAPDTHEESLTQLAEQRARIDKALAAATDTELSGTIPSWGPLPARFGIALAIFELGVHHWDLRAALGEEHIFPDDVIDGVVTLANGFLRRPTEVMPSAPIAYRLAGDDKVSFELHVADGAWARGLGEGLPVCEVSGTDTDVLLYVFGRRTADDALLRVTGTAAAEAAAFKTYFPGP